MDGARVEIFSSRGDESFSLSRQPGNTFQILLSPEIGVSSSEEISVSLIIDGERLSQKVNVPAMRHWTVYIYPHSHVDIGYTNTQENVEFIHKRNLDVAMDLAEQTRNYPEEARFRWNPEVVWPVERYLKSEPADERKRLIDAIKRGDISVDASYVNTNTSACSDEELFQLFSFGKEIENITGKKLETMVQTDIPGMSWGVVTAANENGIKYILSLFNGSDRTGWTHKVSFRPFWWLPLPILQNTVLTVVNQQLANFCFVTQNQRGTKTGQNHGKIKSRTLRPKYPLWNTSVSFAKVQICPLKNEGKSLFLSFTTHFPTIVPQM